MVATPRRTNEATHTTPRNTPRQSSTSRRKRNTRVNDSGTSGESAEQPSANEEVSQKVGRAGTSEGGGAETEMVSGEFKVGDFIAYSNALDKPMRIIEILGDRFRIERLHDGAKFYVYRSLVVRCTEIVAAELDMVSIPEPELKSEVENFNSAIPIETGDCVRGKTATGKEITGFALSVGRTCLKLTSGEFIAMDSVAVLARLPENLEQYCELPGKSRTEKLNELLAEYQFYNLSNWDTTSERGRHFWDYKAWGISFYKGIEVDISKDDETWYTELKRHPEIKGNGDIYNYCVEAIDHAEGIIARLEEYERRATAQPDTETSESAELEPDQDSAEDCQQIIVTQSQLNEFAELVSCLELTKDKIRGTFRWGDKEWVATGKRSSGARGNISVWAESVVPVEQWTEPTCSYSDLVKSEHRPIDDRGQLVKHKRRNLVLTGERVEFVVLEESNSSQIAETQPAPESQADETLTKSEPSHITKDAPRTKFDIGDEVVADYSRYDRKSPPPGLQQIKDGHSGRVSEVKTHGKHVEYLVCFDGVPGRIAVPEHFLRFAEDNRWVFEKGDRIREKSSGRTGTITGQASSASNYVRWDDGTGGVTSKGIAEAIQDELTIATDNNQLAIIETNPESITSGSTLDLLITETKTLYGKLEEAEQVAVSAAHSALEFAREMGDRLLQLKKLAGHGNWERVREQIKSPRTNRPIPSSTAALYQRIFERWSELDAEAVATIREASEALKKPRLNSATVADLQPIVHEKGLADSLEGLRDDFRERKAAAEARSSKEIEQKYERVEDIALPKFNELVALYEAIGSVTPTKDGKGFSVERPDLGNPFPLAFRTRQQAWDYWQRNKDKLLLLAERKPKPDYERSSISGWQQDDVLTTEGGQVGKVLAIADNGKVAVEWDNGHTGLYTPKEIEAYGYRKSGAIVNTPAEFPNAVKTPDSVAHVLGLSEVHYAVRKFAVLNDRQWDEQMCDEVAAAVLDFLAEY